LSVDMKSSATFRDWSALIFKNCS